jgi:putative nucleotidyltransferase with HDIG domain
VAKRLGLEGEDLEALDTAAILHDIGKLAVPDGVLLKPGRLSDDEVGLIQEHAAAGEAILQPIDFGADVAGIVRHHHEKVDGSGYPDGLSGDQIPLGARILAVVDVYDALVSERPYRKAWTNERAVEYLREKAGESFDPRVVGAFVEVLESGDVPQHITSGAAGILPNTGPGLRDTIISRSHLVQALCDPAAVESRNSPMFAAVTEEFVARGILEACVVFEVNETRAELDVVSASGDLAWYLNRTRMSLGFGPSGGVAGTGEPVYNATAAADFDQFAERAPAALSESLVTAIPIRAPNGNSIGVLSLYMRAGAALTEPIASEARLAAALLGRQMASTREPAPAAPPQPKVVVR